VSVLVTESVSVRGLVFVLAFVSVLESRETAYRRASRARARTRGRTRARARTRTRLRARTRRAL